MEEYEYSFKVESIKPFIEYCENNGYKQIEKSSQIRVVYENIHNRHIIARITQKTINDSMKRLLDFKSVSNNRESLKVSNESIPLVINSKNEASINSILDVLNFEKVSSLKRTRYVYELDNVKFEIDDYEEPKMCVVAIEGQKDCVDIVYKKIISLNLIDLNI